MSMPRLQVALRIALLCVMPLVAGQEVAPSPDEVLQGGSFEIQGRRIEVSRAELESHFAFIRALDPKATFPRAYELAWSRAIRIHAAREVGIEIDEAAFARWMERQHRAPSQYWLDEDGKTTGSFDVHDYIAMCKAHYAAVGLGADAVTALFR